MKKEKHEKKNGTSNRWPFTAFLMAVVLSAVLSLASEGMLTRGLEHTGIADVITATALNQASANAYRALLDYQQDLQENDAARSAARADALGEVAELRSAAGKELGDAYKDFYNLEVKELSKAEDAYYYALALQQLKRQWAQEDQARK